MMHMWMWFGYDLGEFMFPGLNINTRWSFALTWIVLFFVALGFEASKVLLAKMQREAYKQLYPLRSDERRNLLADREQAGSMEPTTSRNASSNQVSRWSSLRVRVLVNCTQSLIFVVHNVVGYLLMLAVMVYNVHLLVAVVLGMMLGYFLFGAKLTRLQMQCLGTKRNVICTPECDDTAETSTPPLLESGNSSAPDFYECRTRTCVQPSHYFPSGAGEPSGSCHYGAKHCPSKVARARRERCHSESEKEDSPSVEDAQLLRTERQGCCKKKQEPPPEQTRCKSHEVIIHEPSEERSEEVRAETSQVSCCHAKPTGGQEQIMH